MAHLDQWLALPDEPVFKITDGSVLPSSTSFGQGATVLSNGNCLVTGGGNWDPSVSDASHVVLVLGL